MARILFFQPTLTVTGGIDRWSVTLANEFAKKHEVSILTCYPADERIPRNEKITYASLHELPSDIPIEKLQKIYARVKGLRRYIRSHKPDVVIASADGVCVAALIAKLMMKKPPRVVCVMHQELAHVPFYFRYPLLWLLRYANAIVGVSAGIAGDVQDFIPRARCHIINNAISVDSLTRKSEKAISDEENVFYKGHSVFVAVGRLEKVKGFDRLLKALAKAHEQNVNIRLIVLGEGSERNTLVRMIDTLHLSKIAILAGEKENVAPYIARAEATISTSHFESLGISLIESLACKTPIIALDCQFGPREILQLPGHIHEVKRTPLGVLIPYREESHMINDLADTMQHFSKSEFAASDLARRANDFDSKAIGEQWITLLTSL